MLKQIEKDMMEAVKNKDREKAGALRLLISKAKIKPLMLDMNYLTQR